MLVTDIRQLYDYNYWATGRLLGVVSSLSHDQFAKDLGSSHGGIQGTLVHSMGAEELWLKRWKGESPAALRSVADIPTVDALRDAWKIVERDMKEFCSSLRTQEDAERIVQYRDLKGNPYSQPLDHLMQHLVNHSTYHRGQVVTMLRQSGVKPVNTDLVGFFRQTGH